jgi:hypothetical protein
MLWGKHYLNQTYPSSYVEHYRYALRCAHTPPWGVPSMGSSLSNPTLTPAFRAFHTPFLYCFGKQTVCINYLWSILSKHFSISSSSIFPEKLILLDWVEDVLGGIPCGSSGSETIAPWMKSCFCGWFQRELD